MNLIDILLLAVIALSVWIGIRRGFIIGMIELASWLGSLIIAFLYYAKIAVFIEKQLPSLGIWAIPLAFILAIVLVRTIIAILTNRVLATIPKKTHHHSANHTMGVFPGVFAGLIWAAVMSTLLLTVPVSKNVAHQTRKSKIASALTQEVEKLEDLVSPVIDETIKRSMTKLIIEPGETGQELPYKVKTAEIRNDLESQMLTLINHERTRSGLSPLHADPELSVVARSHSRDMFGRGYFSHITPEGQDPFDRMRSGNARFIAAGENIALAQTLLIAHHGLMQSPGHRANILSASFGRVGIGILDGGIYGLMITQNFRN